MNTSRRDKYVCALAGAVLGFAFPTYHLSFLAWVALGPLLIVTAHTGPRRSAWLFFISGFFFHLVVLQWLLSNAYWTGGWAVWGYAALCAVMAVYWACLGALWTRVRRRVPGAPAWLVLPVLWWAMEFLQGVLFTGFGWTSLAYSQGSGPHFRQLAAVGGTGLISAVLVAANVLLASAVTRPRRRTACVAAVLGLVVAVRLAGMALLDDTEYDDPPTNVGILQANFPLEMKWDSEYALEMVRSAATKSRTMAAGRDCDLIVWPESLIMDGMDAPGVLDPIARMTRDTGAALFTGVQRYSEETGRPLNSGCLVTPEGETALYYDKIRLAPFGEYVPLQRFLPFVRKVVPVISAIEPGNRPVVFEVRDRVFGPLICFEVLFSRMSRRLRLMGAESLVVITNLGWFGASNAIPQELEIARFRAIETRLPVIHCANTGVSGVFDPWGRFQEVRGAFSETGAFYEARNRTARSPSVMQRRGDVLPLPKAAPAPLLRLPLVLSVLVLTVSAFLAGISLKAGGGDG